MHKSKNSLFAVTLSSKITGSTPKKGLAGNSGLRGESSGAGLGDSRIPPVSAHNKRKAY